MTVTAALCTNEAAPHPNNLVNDGSLIQDYERRVLVLPLLRLFAARMITGIVPEGFSLSKPRHSAESRGHDSHLAL